MLDIKYNKPQSKKLVIYGGGGSMRMRKKSLKSMNMKSSV